MGMYGGMGSPFNYGGYGGGYGGYGVYSDPSTGQGRAPVSVVTGPEFSTPLTPLEKTSGELGKHMKSKDGMAYGAVSGMAAGAAAGFFLTGCNPIGGVIGGIAGLFGGGFAGDKIGNLVAVQQDVDKDGKVDGGVSAGSHSVAGMA